MRRLTENGIYEARDLAQRDPAAVAAATGVPEAEVRALVAAATEHTFGYSKLVTGVIGNPQLNDTVAGRYANPGLLAGALPGAVAGAVGIEQGVAERLVGVSKRLLTRIGGR